MGDLLAPSPKRLHRLEGRWVLEVERYAATSPNHYHRVPGRVDGHRAIADLLAGSPLATDAKRLFDAEHDDDRSFDAVDGSWVPSTRPPAEWLTRSPDVLDASAGAPNAEQVSRELGHVERQLAESRERMRMLERRVAALATMLQRITAEGAPAPAAPAPAVPIPASVSAAAAPAPAAAPAAPAASAPSASAPEAAAAPVPAPGDAAAPSSEVAPPDAPAEAAPPPAPEAPAAPPFEPAFRNPGLQRVNDILEGLMDGVEPPRPLEEPIDWPAGAWISEIVDDEDRLVGVGLADLRATCVLGGDLLMLPDSRREELIAEGAPDEDVIDAMSEIFNNVSAAINHTPGNIHVRVRALRFTDQVPEFVAASNTRLDLVEGSGGKMSLIAGPKP